MCEWVIMWVNKHMSNFNRGHALVCHFIVKLKIPSKHNTLLETNMGD